jgi:hypothetical protein
MLVFNESKISILVKNRCCFSYNYEQFSGKRIKSADEIVLIDVTTFPKVSFKVEKHKQLSQTKMPI